MRVFLLILWSVSLFAGDTREIDGMQVTVDGDQITFENVRVHDSDRMRPDGLATIRIDKNGGKLTIADPKKFLRKQTYTEIPLSIQQLEFFRSLATAKEPTVLYKGFSPSGSEGVHRLKDLKIDARFNTTSPSQIVDVHSSLEHQVLSLDGGKVETVSGGRKTVTAMRPAEQTLPTQGPWIASLRGTEERFLQHNYQDIHRRFETTTSAPVIVLGKVGDKYLVTPVSRVTKFRREKVTKNVYGDAIGLREAQADVKVYVIDETLLGELFTTDVDSYLKNHTKSGKAALAEVDASVNPPPDLLALTAAANLKNGKVKALTIPLENPESIRNPAQLVASLVGNLPTAEKGLAGFGADGAQLDCPYKKLSRNPSTN